MNYFSRNIKFLREERQLKQSEMKTFTGINGATWSNYELGKTEPSIDVLIIISKFFRIDIADLINIDLQNVHLIKKLTDAKNAENVHPNVLPIVHPKGNKHGKYIPEQGLEVSFKDSLNEGQAPYNSLKHQMLDLSNKMAIIEANIDKRLSKMEGKIKALEKGNPKM